MDRILIRATLSRRAPRGPAQMTSCESSVVNFPIDRVWDAVRPLRFDWSSALSSDGAEPTVGSTRKITVKGGAVWTIRVLEMSDLKHRVTYELAGSEPAAPYASSVTKISLRPITDNDTTYIEWETTYSSDVTEASLTDSANQMLEAFKELDASLGAGGSSATAGVSAAAIGAGVGAAAEWAFTNTGSSATLLDIRGAREMVSTEERARELLAPVLKDGYYGIKEVRLSTKSFSDESVVVLADVLSKLPDLEIADMDDIISGRMDAEALRVIEAVAKSLAGKKLVQFNASDNAFGPRGLVACKPALLPCLDTLERAYFCNNGLSEHAGELMTEIFTAKGPSNLKLLHVHNNMLGEGGAKNISPLVSQAPHLEDFRFSTTRVPEAGGKVLGAALGHATKLKRLNLSDNTYGIAGATSLAGSLAKMPDMEWLNLCDTGLTEDGAVLVMKATHGMGSLTSLNLAGNEMTEDAIEPLLECLECHKLLTELVLDDNELEDGGAQALAEFLEDDGSGVRLPKLQTLSLCFNEMHSSGAKALARAVVAGSDSGVRTVEQLRLNGNAIGPKGMQELQTLLGERNGDFEDNEEDASDDDE